MGSLVQFNAVALGYRKTKILNEVFCSIDRGDSVGIVGPNGSGKTTFLRGVLGLLKPLAGTIHLDPFQRFAYVPQIEELNFFLPLTVQEAVLLSPRSERILGRITREEKQTAQLCLEKVGLSAAADSLLRECSGGQRQRAILAQALSLKPNILLLDEPTKGLDVVAERDFLALIEKLRVEEKLTILFVTHTLQIPLNFMNKILLFNKGSVIQTTPAELVETKKLEEIYETPFLHHEFHGFRWVLPLPQRAR